MVRLKKRLSIIEKGMKPFARNGVCDAKKNVGYATNTQRKNVKWLGFYLGLWLVSVFLLPLASRVYLNGGFLQVSYVIAILWPELLFIFILKNLIPKRLSTNDVIAIVIFFMAIVLSTIVSVDKLNSALFFVLTIFVFIIILQYKTYLAHEQYALAFKTYSVLALIIAVMFAFYDYRPGIRLGNGTNTLNPNAISLILMSITVASMSFGSRIIKTIIAGLSFYLLYLTGSRTSLVATVVGVLVYVYYSTKVSTRFNKSLLIGSVLLFAVMGVMFFDELWFFINEILKIDDSHRGLTTGASGRMEIWKVGWAMFMDNIVTGIGYRSHEKVLGISAHNGYLATLLEVGVVGFIAIMYLIIKGLFIIKKNLKVNHTNNYNHVLFGFCLGYLLLAMFERYLINIGNPASLIFILAILAPGAMKNYEKI